MKVLVTGACGFVGRRLCERLPTLLEGLELHGLDNLARVGSELNRSELRRLGVRFVHGDTRAASDVDALPSVDWVIDAAANPSALAGVDGRTSSRQVVENNLYGTINLLEYCRARGAGFVLLSTTRVYSVSHLAALPMRTATDRFELEAQAVLPPGAGAAGIAETFPTTSPVSLYGSTKLASEVLALEYGATYGFPVWIDRCGVLAGAGQFGTTDQGVFSHWIHAHARRLALRYIGFDGEGRQVRDLLHPDDLARLIATQLRHGSRDAGGPGSRTFAVGGGAQNSVSLRELTRWCDARFGQHAVGTDPTPRPFDVPWIVVDASRAEAAFGWRPERSLDSILSEIAAHAEAVPDWLERVKP